MPPPIHKPADRKYQFALNPFDPATRQCVEGVWVDSTLSLIGELFTCLRLQPPNALPLEVQALLPPLQQHLRRNLSPQDYSRLLSRTRDDFSLPWAKSTPTPPPHRRPGV